MIFLYVLIGIALTAFLVYMAFIIEMPVYTFILGQWVISMNAMVFIFLAVLFVLVCYFIIRTVAWPNQMLHRFSRYKHKRRLEKADLLLGRGLSFLISGSWKEARKTLSRAARYSKNPTASYLAAAYAAEQDGDKTQREQYLRKAYDKGGSGDPTTILSWVRMRIEQERYQDSVTMLQDMLKVDPDNDIARAMLISCHRHLQDWDKAQALIPQDVFLVPARFRHPQLKMEANLVYAYRLDRAAEKKQMETLEQCWNTIPANLRSEKELCVIYISHRLRFDKHDRKSEQMLKTMLRSQYDHDLVTLYGMCEGKTKQQLSFFSKLMKKHPNDPDLLLTVGQVTERIGLLGKAKAYYRQSIDLKPSLEGYRRLGVLSDDDENATEDTHKTIPDRNTTMSSKDKDV